MAEWKCQFCGSSELKVNSDYVELKSDGEYGPIENFCCFAQKKNHQYVLKNYDPDNRPDPDEVAKW